MIKEQEQNQNLIEDRLPIRTEDKKRKTSLKENKFFQGLKGKAVRNTFFAFLGLFILGGYLFFFTSNMIIPTSTKYLFTPPGQVANFSPTRTVTLVRWNYSPQQKLMEIIVSMENNDYNGKDTYQSNCIVNVGGKDYKATLTPIISETNYYVMHIKNVPNNFGQATLQIQIKDDNTADSVRLYTNRNEIKVVDNITAKTKEEYLQEQAQDSIEQYQADMEELQKQNEDIKIQITNIENVNLQLEEDKKYQTEKEITETNKKITRNTSEIKKLEETIKTNESLIKENEEKIKKANERIASLS